MMTVEGRGTRDEGRRSKTSRDEGRMSKNKGRMS